MTIGIYEIQLLIGKKQKYVGSSKNIERRWKQHQNLLNKQKHSNKYLQLSWNKYGAENFIMTVIESFNHFDYDLLITTEQKYLDLYKVNPTTFDRNLVFNLHYYAGGGSMPSLVPAELCELRRKNMIGNELSVGEKSPTATLTNEQVIEIKHLLNNTSISIQELADRFHTAYRNIDRIAKNENWIKVGERVLENPCRNKKFTKEDVLYIRNSSLSVKELSQKFNVHPCTIRRVISRQTYKNI